MAPRRGGLSCLALLASVLPVLPVLSGAAAALPALNASATNVTISGVSSGAFFAVQLFVAFSATFQGVASLAGGPFYCAQGSAATALGACMRYPALVSVAELVQITRNTALTGTIDALSHLGDTRHRAYLLTGRNDTVVAPAVAGKKLRDYLSAFLGGGGSGAGAVRLRDDLPAEHAWITRGYGNNCSVLGTPYMNHCSVDVAGELLQHLFDHTLRPPPSSPSPRPEAVGSWGGGGGTLVSFDQTGYAPPLVPWAAVSMADTGFLYIPRGGCGGGSGGGSGGEQDGGCRLHVAMHGCKMAPAIIGTQFVVHSGLNEWGDANGIAILYPSARASVLNPNGCWDWWGYTSPAYASKLGLQMATVRAMVVALLREDPAASHEHQGRVQGV